MRIILSPHYDDAVLSLGGMLAKESNEILVVTVFGGVPSTPVSTGFDTTCGFGNSTEAIQERIKENDRALGSLGIQGDRIRNWEHLDVQYRFPGVRVLSGTPEHNLEIAIATQIVSLAQEFSSAEIYLPGLISHVDHALVRHAALMAMQSISTKEIKFFFYQDLPYSIGRLDKRPGGVRGLFWKPNDYQALKRAIVGPLKASEQTVLLSEENLDKKMHAAELYASQINGLGKDLPQRLKDFAKRQAQHIQLSAPYCEVVYKIER